MIFLYKPFGLTPLQAINVFKEKNPDYRDRKLSYAGRLDPMAEGLVLILIDEENKDRRKLEHLSKEYEFEALLGIKTDSYDLLGMPKIINKDFRLSEAYVNKFIENHIGKITQEYPPYSSIKVKGKPLYWWARRDIQVTAPKKEVEIKKLELENSSSISSQELAEIVYKKIKKTDGDFRQEEILARWDELLKNNPNKSFPLLKFTLSCSSGGYVRSLVNSLGEYLKCGSVTFSIKRTKIGENLDIKIYTI